MTRRAKPVLHGRDHAPDGADPINAILITIQNEGVDLPQRATINFIGDAVNAYDDPANNRTIVEIICCTPGSTGGVNDATVDATWTQANIFGVAIVEPTVANGTTPGYWHADATATKMVCDQAGTWRIAVAGTVTYTAGPPSTEVQIRLDVVDVSAGTNTDDVVFDATMSPGGTGTVSFTHDYVVEVTDHADLMYVHLSSSSSCSSTFEGTMTFTRIA